MRVLLQESWKTALVVALLAGFGGCAWDPFIQGEPMEVVSPDALTIRAVTKGPKFHWFGYYDVRQFDPSQRYLLGMEVDFEGRDPTAADAVKIGMVDLRDGDRWIELGESRAWCWQQGCRLQWRPASQTEVVWNDKQGDKFVCHILDVKSRKERVLPHPIYDISPDGKLALGTDFARLNDMRPGYGYVGLPDRNRDSPAPENSGIYSLDLDTGAFTFLFSIAAVAKIQYEGHTPPAKLCFNHIKWSPDGKRFLFYCHEEGAYGGIFAYTAAADGSAIRRLAENPTHYTWRNAGELLLYSGGAFRLFRDNESGHGDIMWRARDGHPSFLPDGQWIVVDTYPFGRAREQFLYLFDLQCRKIVELGHFHSPSEYRGAWRCDLHPRVSPDGSMIAIDSTHGGNGRQIYVIDNPFFKK